MTRSELQKPYRDAHKEEKRLYDIAYRQKIKNDPVLREKHLKRQRAYAKKNQAKRSAYYREYKKINKTRLSAEAYEYSQSPKGRFASYHNRAKYGSSMPLEFSITMEDFMTFWKKPCHYCGDDVKTIGLDRINNNIGYRKENLVSCCSLCNWMKKDMDVGQFMSHIRKIAVEDIRRLKKSFTDSTIEVPIESLRA